MDVPSNLKRFDQPLWKAIEFPKIILTAKETGSIFKINFAYQKGPIFIVFFTRWVVYSTLQKPDSTKQKELKN